MRYRLDIQQYPTHTMSVNERRELTKSTVDDLFAAAPPSGVKVKTDRCPLGLTKGMGLIIKDKDVQFQGEKPIPAGTRVVFTRYMYDRTILGYGANQYVRMFAFFMFPDESERSLSNHRLRPAKG